MTVEEVASHLKKHPETIRRLRRTGEIKGVRIGRHWYFDLSSMDSFLVGDTGSRRRSGDDEQIGKAGRAITKFLGRVGEARRAECRNRALARELRPYGYQALNQLIVAGVVVERAGIVRLAKEAAA